ncbi:MAG: hypothetical protein MUC83_12655, partial [Pirellula sp.]|nr:hypothetical protein [Pirellula sp.]
MNLLDVRLRLRDAWITCCRWHFAFLALCLITLETGAGQGGMTPPAVDSVDDQFAKELPRID